jgi:hypothetical protein
MSSSASLQYSQLGWSSFQKVYIAFAGNSDLCLSLLRNCADYGKKVLTWCFPSIASPTSSRAGGPYNTREWTTERQSEVTGISVKRLETPEGVGGVGALVRGLGTHPTHDLSTRMRTPPSSHASHDPTVHSLTDPPKPDIMITPPAGEPQGPHSMTSLEDGLRFLHQDNILPQRSRENFLHLTWLPVKDKVSVSSRRSSTLSGSQT